jgi:hypothetical protein
MSITELKALVSRRLGRKPNKKFKFEDGSAVSGSAAAEHVLAGTQLGYHFLQLEVDRILREQGEFPQPTR